MFLNHVPTAIIDYKRNRMQMISLLEYGLLPHYHYLEYTYYINIHHRNLEPEPINPHQSLRAVGTEDVVPSSWYKAEGESCFDSGMQYFLSPKSMYLYKLNVTLDSNTYFSFLPAHSRITYVHSRHASVCTESQWCVLWFWCSFTVYQHSQLPHGVPHTHTL